MINKKEVSAIIVARSGSVRIPSKNLLKIGNETLISRKIRQLKESTFIDKVIVGSDSDEILAQAKDHGAECVRRPVFFCDEEQASANDMIRNMMTLISKTDIVVWAHCTNPMLKPQTYDMAIQFFCEGLNLGYDSVLSVVELREHLWKDGKPLNYDPYQLRHTLARELPPLYMQDGGIFIQPYEQMKENCYFFGKKPRLFVIPKDEFLDINEKRDYELAKAIIERNE